MLPAKHCRRNWETVILPEGEKIFSCMEPDEIDIASLKNLAASKKSVIRVLGRMDVHFFSVNPEGEVYSAAMEIIPEERMEAFFADVLAHAEKFLIEGRIWRRELNRAELRRLLASGSTHK